MDLDLEQLINGVARIQCDDEFDFVFDSIYGILRAPEPVRANLKAVPSQNESKLGKLMEKFGNSYPEMGMHEWCD